MNHLNSQTNNSQQDPSVSVKKVREILIKMAENIEALVK